jgi:hypothetical protein
MRPSFAVSSCWNAPAVWLVRWDAGACEGAAAGCWYWHESEAARCVLYKLASGFLVEGAGRGGQSCRGTGLRRGGRSCGECGRARAADSSGKTLTQFRGKGGRAAAVKHKFKKNLGVIAPD